MKLIADLNNTLSKRPFRVFKIQHGIDRLEVLVPLDQVDAFKEAVDSTMSKQRFLQVLAEHQGKVRA
jgi:hypothetical protein